MKWIVYGVSGLVAAYAIVQPVRPAVVVGSSMAPTYHSGEVLWTVPVDRLLQRGDVVVADGPDGPVIKRVVLLPGDHRMQWLGPAGWEDLTTSQGPSNRRYSHRVKLRSCVVPVGTVFLLGDNVGVSIDSREFGPVDIEKVRRLVLDSRAPDGDSDVAGPTPSKWIAGAIRHGRRDVKAKA